jgi:hypothetical protein
MKPITDIRNKNILTFFKAVKYINKLQDIDEAKIDEFKKLEAEIEQSIQT